MSQQHIQPNRPPLPVRGVSDASTQSHQTGIIKEHWNDLPADFTPTTSRSVSRTGTPLSRGESGTPVTTVTDSAGGEMEFEAALSALIGTPSKLSPADTQLLGSKVTKVLSSITPEQQSELGHIIKAVAIEKSETPAWGRERVVEFMMREKGVAGWAIAVRKMVENII